MPRMPVKLGMPRGLVIEPQFHSLGRNTVALERPEAPGERTDWSFFPEVDHNGFPKTIFLSAINCLNRRDREGRRSMPRCHFRQRPVTILVTKRQGDHQHRRGIPWNLPGAEAANSTRTEMGAGFSCAAARSCRSSPAAGRWHVSGPPNPLQKDGPRKKRWNLRFQVGNRREVKKRGFRIQRCRLEVF